MAQMLTANRLVDGIVLYWWGGAWTESFAEGEVFATDATAEAALAAARDSVARNLIVAPYLFELKDGQPLKEREIIRAAGPSVRTDLGKQAVPPPEALRASTSPQGGGEKDSDVSL